MGTIEKISPMEIGRAMVKKYVPYMYRLVYGLIPYPTEEVETLGVTPGMVVYFNPTYYGKQPDKKKGGLLLHEGMHPFQRHDARRGPRDPTRWNLAGDATINPPILETGLELPEEGIFPEKFGLPNGKTTEWYYDNWPKDADGGHLMVARGLCGGCAGHPGSNAELEQRIDREMGRGAVDRVRIEKQVASAIQAHVRQHGRGSVPGTFVDWAETVFAPPKVAWEAELGSVFRSAYGQALAGGQDYSLARPSKRSLVRGIIRPGLVDYQPRVAVAVDTSGSMGSPRGRQIQSGLCEIAGIMRELGSSEVWLLQADAAVATQPRLITLNDLRHLEIRGGGGTDFGPAIREAELLYPRPNILVYFTDGDGACPEAAPQDIAVIWAIVPGRWSVKHPLPWGRTIWIKE